jgi:ADP-heptose:LPS heptosyltransferase
VKILLLRQDHLGDLILTTPLIRSLAQAGHSVDVIAREKHLCILDYNPHITSKYAFEEITPTFPRGWRQLGSWMREQRYDALIYPHARPKELLFAGLFSGISNRIAMWAGVWGRLTGFRCLRSGLPGRARHMSDIWLDCARSLGAKPAGLQPEIFISSEEKTWAKAELRRRFGERPVIGVHPGSAGNTCNLPPAEYGAFCELVLRNTDCALVITGIANESLLLTHWPDTVLRSDRVWNSMGDLLLRQLAAIIARLDLMVSVGTGPMHIASATQTATLSPFCPYVGVSPQVWGNLGGEAVALEAPTAICDKIVAGSNSHCDFKATITADVMFVALTRLLATSPSRQN